jgi:hypothetical protein
MNIKPTIYIKIFAALFIFLFGIFFVINCDNKDSSPHAQSDDKKNSSANRNTEPTQKNINEPRWVNAESGLKLRSGPGTDFDTLDVIPYGDEVELVTIDGTMGKWSMVRWQKNEGWVFGGFLSESKPGPNIVRLSDKFSRGIYGFTRDKNRNIYAETSTELWFSKDQGKNWKRIYNVGSILGCVINDENYIFIITHDKKILCSTDAGESWKNRSIEGLTSNDKIKLLLSPKGYILAVVDPWKGTDDYYHLYISRDNGKTWEVCEPKIKKLISMAFNSNADIFILDKYDIYTAKDEYREWDKFSLRNDKDALEKLFHEQEGVTYAAPEFGTILVSIYYREYSYVSYADLYMSYAECFDSNGVLYLFADNKFFYSADNGASWRNFSIIPKMMCYTFDSANALYIGTRDGKVYKTNNKGETWQEIIQLPADSNGVMPSIIDLYVNDLGWLIISDHVLGYS